MKATGIYVAEFVRNLIQCLTGFGIAVAIFFTVLLDSDPSNSDVITYFAPIAIFIIWGLYLMEKYLSRSESFLILVAAALTAASILWEYHWWLSLLNALSFWGIGLYNLFEEKRPKPFNMSNADTKSPPSPKAQNGGDFQEQVVPSFATDVTLTAIPTQVEVQVPEIQRVPPVEEIILQASDRSNSGHTKASNDVLVALNNLIPKDLLTQALTGAGVENPARYADSIYGSRSRSGVYDLLTEQGGKARSVIVKLLESAFETQPPAEIHPPDEPDSSSITVQALPGLPVGIDIDELLKRAVDSRNLEGLEAAKLILGVLLGRPRDLVEAFLAENGITSESGVYKLIFETNDPKGISFFLRPLKFSGQRGKKERQEVDRDKQPKRFEAMKKFLTLQPAQPASTTVSVDNSNIEDTQPNLQIPERDAWVLVVRAMTDTSGECAKTLYSIFQAYGLEHSVELLKNEDFGVSEGDAKTALKDAKELRGALLNRRRFEYVVFDALIKIQSARL